MLQQRMHTSARAALFILVMVSLVAVGGLVPARAQTNIDEGRLIAPSGPYPVGRTAYQWTDESRGEIHTDDPDDSRELLVEVWYPADPADDAELAPYVEPPTADMFAAFYGATPELAVQILSNAYADAPLASDQETYPVILFDPGFSIPPRQYSVLLEEFASYGYIVFAPSHPYVTGMTVMLDGRAIQSASTEQMAHIWGPGDIDTPEFQEVWVPDVLFVLDQIEMVNADDPNGRFTGRLALENGVGLVGHSQGARTVSEVCWLDDRCAAAVNIDGIRSAQVDLDLDKPYLYVMADQGVAYFASMFDRGFEAMSQDFIVLMIPRSTHGSSFDLPFTMPLMSEQAPSADLFASQQTLVDYRIYIRAFLDEYVKGEPSPLMAGPSAQFPEVFFLKREEPIEPATANADPQPAALGPNFGAITFGEADVWLYEGEAGEVLDLWLMADRPANDSNQQQRLEFNLMDTLLAVRAPDGSLLAANDDFGGGLTDSALEDLELPVAGTYQIVVRTWQGETAGNYTLLINSDREREAADSATSE